MRFIASMARRGFLAAMLAAALFPAMAVAQGTGNELDFVRAAVQGREAAKPVQLHARYEIEQRGSQPVLPGGRFYGGKPGREMRQVFYEEWWVDGERYASAQLAGGTLWIDDEVRRSVPVNWELPRATASFDGLRGYKVDLETPERPLLVVNNDWRGGDCTCVISWGRAVGREWLSEFLSAQGGHNPTYVGQEDVDGLKCFVVRADGLNGAVEDLYLAEDLGFMWVKYETRYAGRLTLCRTVKLLKTADGLGCPEEAREEYTREDGSGQVTTWRLVPGSADYRPPKDDFAPSEASFDRVMDLPSRQMIKGK